MTASTKPIAAYAARLGRCRRTIIAVMVVFPAARGLCRELLFARSRLGRLRLADVLALIVLQERA
jgi:hypothetical protein